MRKNLIIFIVLVIVIIYFLLRNMYNCSQKEIYSEVEIVEIQDSWTLVEQKESSNKDYIAQVYKETGTLSVSDDKLFVIIKENRNLINKLVYVNNNWWGSTYTLKWLDEDTIIFDDYNININKDCIVIIN